MGPDLAGAGTPASFGRVGGGGVGASSAGVGRRGRRRRGWAGGAGVALPWSMGGRWRGAGRCGPGVAPTVARAGLAAWCLCVITLEIIIQYAIMAGYAYFMRIYWRVVSVRPFVWSSERHKLS